MSDKPPASPVCLASEASDAYAGYLDREEVLSFLNVMLEAERAGARITALTATETTLPDMNELMRNVHHDEARWFAMLLKWIFRLEGTPSERTGDFYEKCLAVPGLFDRVALINRGQGWVVRKLREVLPKIRDSQMHADLTEMLASHEVNITRANEACARNDAAS